MAGGAWRWFVPIGLAALVGVGCSGDEQSGDAAVAVTADDSTCEVATTELAAGTHTFAIRNAGGDVTEVYVYRANGSIVSERENIAPGTRADLTVELAAGDYEVACKPGMRGDGIRTALTVTATSASRARDPRLDAAVTSYRAYVEVQVADSLRLARKLAIAIERGNVATAKRIYAPSRIGWERVEPVAESFGDIDPKIDLREADLETGQRWTGWHRIEKALWVKQSTRGLSAYADRLIADLEDLQVRITRAEITPTSMANGAKELLDEVATGKITGEEEAFSHTDLVDFAANIDGAAEVVGLLRTVVVETDPDYVELLEKRVAAVRAALAQHRQGSGYVSYDTVPERERKELADVVNALAEPLSRLAATLPT